MSTTQTMIEIRDLAKKYDDGPPALAGVTLDIQTGECLAVLGHSGSGKSTLLNIIAGLDKPSGGSVTVDGTRVDQLSEAGSAKYRRAKVGMVFQFFNLLDDMTVLDNVLVPAQLAGMPRAEARRRAAELHRDGQTIVLVTHDAELAAATASRTIELVDGAVVRDVAAVVR